MDHPPTHHHRIDQPIRRKREREEEDALSHAETKGEAELTPPAETAASNAFSSAKDENTSGSVPDGGNTDEEKFSSTSSSVSTEVSSGDTCAERISLTGAPQNKMSTPVKKSAAAPGTSPSSPIEAPAALCPKLPLHVRTRPQTPPLHPEVSSGRTRAADAAEIFRGNDNDTSSTPPPSHKRPRLSLSAYRKPDAAVRLTDADPSRSVRDDYDLDAPGCRVLGHGAASTVRLAVRRSDGARVAVKTIAKHDILFSRRGRGRGRRRKKTLDECDILSQLSGDPRVVALLDTYEDSDEVQLVLEYCEGGELFDAVRRRQRRSPECRGSGYTEAQCADIAGQLLSALESVHARGIVHRDVKPENVLLMSSQEDDTRVKLSDFGLARILETPTDCFSSSDNGSSGEESGGESPMYAFRRSRAYSCVGSNYYTAPEVMSGSGYDTAVDVYSLGATLYVLLCGDHPRECSNDAGPVEFLGSHWENISDDAKDLVRRLMDPDPVRRIKASDALRHPWIVRNRKGSETTALAPSGRRSGSGDRRGAKCSRLAAAAVPLRPPPTFPFSPPVALCMTDLLSKMNRIATDASAAAAESMHLIDGDDDESETTDGRPGSPPFGPALTALSV